MKIKMKSALSGVVHEREVPVDPAAYLAWKDGLDTRFVQDAFPELSADDREFLLTGVTPEEWAAMLPVEDDDDE